MTYLCESGKSQQIQLAETCQDNNGSWLDITFADIHKIKTIEFHQALTANINSNISSTRDFVRIEKQWANKHLNFVVE